MELTVRAEWTQSDLDRKMGLDDRWSLEIGNYIAEVEDRGDVIAVEVRDRAGVAISSAWLGVDGGIEAAKEAVEEQIRIHNAG